MQSRACFNGPFNDPGTATSCPSWTTDWDDMGVMKFMENSHLKSMGTLVFLLLIF